jgi:hypothetical protein
MSWCDIRVYGWQEFCRKAEHITARVAVNENLFCRGQANMSWPLMPSLLRYARNRSEKDVLEMEASATKMFRTAAWAFAPQTRLPDDDDVVEWWMLMQHYGAPTRILDWSGSPFVALYFAVIDEPTKDAAVWFFDAQAFADNTGLSNGNFFKETPDLWSHFMRPNNPDKIHTARPDRPTGRIIAQNGLMALSENPKDDHGKTIDKVLTGSGRSRVQHGRLIIPAERKALFLMNLINMNIRASTLFPGLDGLGRDVKEAYILERGARRRRVTRKGLRK